MRKLSTLVLLLGALLLARTQGWAQLRSGYQFQAQAGTYEPLGAGATRLPTLEADEALATGVPLGFPFVARSHFFTQAVISTNGWLGLTNEPETVRFPAALSTDIDWQGAAEITIAPLWSDLSGSGGTALYQTTGAAPNRVFTMEWRNFRWDKLATQPVISFQLRLYEGSNRIEFQYRPEAGEQRNSNPTSRGRAGIARYDYYTTKHEPIVLTNLGPAPELRASSSDGFLQKPASGQQYSFTPVPNTVPACQLPYYHKLDYLGRTTARVVWSYTKPMPGGTPRVHYGPRGFVLGSAADKLAPGMPGDSAHLTGLLPATDYEFLVEVDCGTSTAPARSARTGFRTATPPSNDHGYRAIWVPVVDVWHPGRPQEGLIQDATTSLPPGSCAVPTGPVRDIWYAFRATGPRDQVMVDNNGQTGTLAVELRDGYGPNSHSLGCGLSPAPLQPGNLVAGKAYFIRVYPLTPAVNNFRLAVLVDGPPAPANDECAAAQLLAVAPTPEGVSATKGTVRSATPTPSLTTNFGMGACALAGSGDKSRDVFYRFVAPGPVAEVQLRPAFRAGVDVMSSCDNAPFTHEDCVEVPAGKLGRLPLTGLTPGATYFLRVYNWWENIPLDDPTFSIAVSVPPVRPANDECAAALPLPVTSPLVMGVTGTLHGATDSGLAPPKAVCYVAPSMGQDYIPPAAAHDVWYQFTATATTHALNLTSATDALLEVFGGSGPPCAGPAGPALGCALARDTNQLFAQPTPGVPARLLLTQLTVGATYWVRVFPTTNFSVTKPQGQMSFELSLNAWPTPANDEPGGATALAISQNPEPCTATSTYTLDGATPTFSAAANSREVERDVWFSFVAPAALPGDTYARIRLRSTDPTQYLMQGDIELRDGPGPAAVILAASGIRTTSGVWVRDHLLTCRNLLPGRRYYLRVLTVLPHPEPNSRFSFCLSTTFNDEPCDAAPLPISAAGQCSQPVRGTTAGASISSSNSGLGLSIPNCAPGYYTNDVWYRVVPTTTAFTLRCDDVAVELARLYKPVGADAACTGALELVNCQVSRGKNTSAYYALGTVMFDNIIPGQPYYLAISNAGFYLPEGGSFTLCAQAATALPVRPAAAHETGSLWPNPSAVGVPLNVRLPVGKPANAQVRVEWLTAVGQVLPALGQARSQAVDGVLRLSTTGRPPGLYLLRLWLPDGQPLPVHRVVLE